MPRRLVVLCAIATLALFAGLGRAAISESDEAYYAEAAREMVETGDWLTPHFNYEVRFQKPILYYWIAAVCYTAAGVSEAAARFGSALSGLGLALITWAGARRLYGESTAFIAGAVAATNFGYFAMAHLALPDLPLTFFVTLTTWLGFRSLDRPEALGPWVGAATAAALGALMKGPLGLLLPALVVVPIAGVEGRLRAFPPRRLIAGALVFCAIALPWYVAMTWTHGMEYLRGFLVGDNLERFATARFNDPRPPWYYVQVAAGGLLPWTFFAILLGGPAWRCVRRRRRLSADERRLAAWVILPLVFFTLSVGKQPRYILPILPPLAILIARAIDVRLTPAVSPRIRGVRAAGVAAALVIVAIGLTLFRIGPLLAVTTGPSRVAALSILIVALGLAATAGVLIGPARAIVPSLAWATAVTLALLQYGLLSTPRSEPVELVAAAIKEHRRANEPVGAYHALVRNLVFYTHIGQAGLFDSEQTRTFLRSPERVLCVLLTRDAADYERDGERFIRLAEFRYFDTATMKLPAVLSPDPDRDLTSIVVVANR